MLSVVNPRSSCQTRQITGTKIYRLTKGSLPGGKWVVLVLHTKACPISPRNQDLSQRAKWEVVLHSRHIQTDKRALCSFIPVRHCSLTPGGNCTDKSSGGVNFGRQDEIMEDCLRHSQDAGVDLLTGERLTDVDYADDKVFLFYNFQAALTMLDAILRSAKYFGMRFGASKCKVLLQGCCDHVDLMLDNVVTVVVDRFVYLGSCISSGGGVGNEIEARISKSRAVFTNLRHLWRQRGISLKLKGRVYKTTVRALLLYGSETWPLMVEDLNRLQVFDYRCLRSVAGIGWHERAFTVITSILQFVVPCLVISVCYYRVSCALRARCETKIGSGMKSREKEESDIRRKRRTNRLLIAMVIILVICWIPLHAFWIVVDVFQIDMQNNDIFIWCHMLAMSSTVYNPFLYAWLNNNFRQEFKAILQCKSKRNATAANSNKAGGALQTVTYFTTQGQRSSSQTTEKITKCVRQTPHRLTIADGDGGVWHGPSGDGAGGDTEEDLQIRVGYPSSRFDVKVDLESAQAALGGLVVGGKVSFKQHGSSALPFTRQLMRRVTHDGSLKMLRQCSLDAPF
ncbi:uncharacterized protein DEA37_0012315 [Paragonimus westermani]|uniref:G-protein coupled receptors family 1 profile domain-containing protein n=1 Tax=Paragonimus westermani TaxID=34504 RepID=A0A5J4NRD3_9TREM|nr:uncharacterized protein DEA37_0012315 [Paragonimus westermani]